MPPPIQTIADLTYRIDSLEARFTNLALDVKDLKTMAEIIPRIEADVNTIKTDFAASKTLMRSIYDALSGDLGKPGLIHEHNEMRPIVFGFRRWVWYAAGLVGGLSFAGSAFGPSISTWLKSILVP